MNILKMILRVIILLTSLLNYAMCSDNQPSLQIAQGKLTGLYVKTLENRTVSAFNSIPYAQAPLKELRFEPPKPPKPWTGVLDATKTPPMCPQVPIATGGTEVIGVEDCLYLSIYTPKLEFNGLKKFDMLPVLIFIHGGGFLLGGSAIFGPGYLLDKDLVLVTTSYRLGPLGFLSTGDRVVPGNNGLKDQSMAIKWVHANIARFGGDPDKITVFGQSAGGASSHLHMLSPLSKGLIKGVISESGTAFSAWAMDPNNRTLRNTLKLASSFNCPINSSKQLVNCLKKVDVYEITKRQHDLYEWYGDPMIPFRPVVETDVPGAFLPEDPKEIIKSGKAANIPFVTGITTEDGAMKSPALFASSKKLEQLSSDFDRVAPITFLYKTTVADPDFVTSEIKRRYLKNKTLDDSSFSRKAVTDIYTDSYFLAGANEALWLHFNYTEHPVYYYGFGYRGSVSYSTVFGGGSYDYGVCHVDDLLYLSPPCNDDFPNYTLTDSDRMMMKVMTALWTNFAYTGNPTPLIDKVIRVKWNPVQSGNLEYYMIKSGKDIKMDEKLYWDRSEFWKSVTLN